MGKVYGLPEELRPKLAKPIGRLFTRTELETQEFTDAVQSSSLVITVGDRVTETLGQMGRVPDVQVVDGRENRKEREPPKVPFVREIRVENPAGTITEEAITGLKEAISGKKPVRVSVSGEEDLLAIPVIALANPQTILFYGQPGEGIVMVKVDSVTKARNRGVLAQMGISEMP